MFFIMFSVRSHFGARTEARPACLVERHLPVVSAPNPPPVLSPDKAGAHRMATPSRGRPFRSA
jgi:hypothetical protein